MNQLPKISEIKQLSSDDYNNLTTSLFESVKHTEEEKKNVKSKKPTNGGNLSSILQRHSLDKHLDSPEYDNNTKKELTPEDVEKQLQEIQGKICDNRKDLRTEKDLEDYCNVIESSQDGKSTGDVNGYYDPSKMQRDYNRLRFDWSKIRPTFNWNQIINYLIKSTIKDEETYARPSNRAISNIMTGLHTQNGFAVKPNEAPVSSGNCNMCFMVDSSGSMCDVLGKVYANINTAFRNYGVDPVFYLIKFSDDFKIYKCNASSNVYSIVSPVDLAEEPSTKGKVMDLFSYSFNGGTNFSSDILIVVNMMINMGINVVALSDSDMMWSNNFINFAAFLKLESPKAKTAFILDSRQSYDDAITKLKTAPTLLTYLEN